MWDYRIIWYSSLLHFLRKHLQKSWGYLASKHPVFMMIFHCLIKVQLLLFLTNFVTPLQDCNSLFRNLFTLLQRIHDKSLRISLKDLPCFEKRSTMIAIHGLQQKTVSVSFTWNNLLPETTWQDQKHYDKNFHILHSNDFEVKSKNSMTFIATYPIIKIRWTQDCSRPHIPQSMGITTRGSEGRIIVYLYTRPKRKVFMTKNDKTVWKC